MYITATGVGVKFDIKKVDDISLSARAAMLHLLAVMEVNAHRLNLPKEEFTELLEKEIGLPLSAEYPTILTLDLIQKINKAINDIFRKLAKSENKRQE